VIADRIDMDIQVDLVTQKQYGNIRYYARKRVGGHCVMPEAIKLQKVAVS
jgi:predicted phage gp36 major capsid-like protein